MTSLKPRVSIGMPVYNGAQYLERALDTLLAQTFTDFEIVITDNCSTDNTQEICERYAAQDDRVKYHRNETNIGASRNYNRCYDLAIGEYFKWAAHDDEHAPTYLEKTVALLDTHPDAVLAHSYTDIIDRNSNVIPVPDNVLNLMVKDPDGGEMRVGVEYSDRHVDSDSVSERYQGILLQTSWCYDIFGLMRRNALANTNLQESFYRTDKVLLAEMVLQGKFLHVPERLFLNRRHAKQSGNIKTAKEREAWNNPSAAKHHPIPQWLCMKGYTRAMWKTSMSRTERARCVSILARYATDMKSWLTLFNEKLDLNLHIAMKSQPKDTGSLTMPPLAKDSGRKI
ncbi:MAG: glycosyltransferase family 2 protein [Anaerolineae bacterium]|nr:glycosyltransferase family 2 protein [Anaerolineae bacterium]